MNENKFFKLNEICEFKYGKMPVPNKLCKSGYSIFSGYKFGGFYPEYTDERERLIVIARGVGGIGDVKIAPAKCFITNLSIIIFEEEKEVLYRYLYYYLKNSNLRALDTGSCQSQITINQLGEYQIRIPDLEKQSYILKILSSLDDKIELNNRINVELEAMAKTIYDYWFVQFDFPDVKGKPYKSSGGKMVYNEKLKREIPEGWEVKTLIEITSLIRRGISPKYVEEGGHLVLNQKCIRNQTISFGLGRRHDNKLSINDERFIELGDVLVNSTGVGTLGRVAFVKYIQEEKSTVDSHVTIVRGNPDLINTEYLNYWMLKSEKDIERAAEGSTGQVELRKEFLENMSIIKPSDNIQKKFSNIIIPLNGEMESREKENQRLASLRDWLLPMLMNGQVGFKEMYQEQIQTVNVAAEAKVEYKPTPKNDNFQVGLKEEKTPIINLSQQQDQRFELWLSSQGLAARGEIDKTTLREIFNVMDEEEYGK
nr:restriction endonuclease subunit S [uncultured Bacteroides sp.]